MKNQKNLNISSKFVLLKKNCLKLRSSSQLPNELCLEIMHLGVNSDERLVKHLLELSNHYLRVNGYYKKYPKVHVETNKLISDDLKQFKESIE